ncbi:MAG: hypothetical protein Q9196_001788 [Gyalolechia fulgens]
MDHTVIPAPIHIIPCVEMFTRLRNLVKRLSVFGWSAIWWQPVTPLSLRLSLRRLLYGSSHPLRIFFSLLQPFPWHFKLSPHQLRPLELKRNPRILLERHDGIFQLRCIPLFEMRDTPLRSVYRLYEYMCTARHSQVQYETEYFYFHSDPARWSVETIPDPKDEDEQRYAFVACIVEALVAAFNWRLSIGLQRDRSRLSFAEMEVNPPRTLVAPQWATSIPPLHEPLELDDTVDRRMTPFVARNIYGANNAHMYSI